MTFFFAGVVLCLTLSAFFSAAEMAFSSCNKVRLEHEEEAGNRMAKTALHIAEHFDDALSAILVGNNLVNIASSSIASLVAILFFGERFTWIATALITVLVILFGETIPKILASQNATRFSLWFAYPVRLIMILLRPVTFVVVGLVNLLTHGIHGEDKAEGDEAVQELHTIIDTAEDEEVLDEDASELVNAAIDFLDISVSEVMTARVDMLAIDIEDEWERILRIVDSSRFSRIPVFEGSVDKIIGILSLNHFLKALSDGEKVDIRSLLMPACFVYKTMKLPAVLSSLRNAQQHLAIVTDEYGGTLGIVSMEDVLEQIVGDIWDETDTIELDVVERSEGVYELDGDMPVSELVDLMEWQEEKFDFESETVGGWCIEMLDGFPSVGSTFVYHEVSFTVVSVETRRVSRVMARKPSATEKGKKSAGK